MSYLFNCDIVLELMTDLFRKCLKFFNVAQWFQLREC